MSEGKARKLSPLSKSPTRCQISLDAESRRLQRALQVGVGCIRYNPKIYAKGEAILFTPDVAEA